MKTEVKIWQGKSSIVLYAENDFEEDLIEKIVDSRLGYDIETSIMTDTDFYAYTNMKNHRVEISLTEKTK